MTRLVMRYFTSWECDSSRTQHFCECEHCLSMPIGCQHDAYIRSAKSYAAHIVGLCLALEFGQTGPSASVQLSRWLNGRGPHDLVKPAGPIPRASTTIALVGNGRTSDELAAALDEFAKSVWNAWHPQHEVARRWARNVQSLR